MPRACATRESCSVSRTHWSIIDVRFRQPFTLSLWRRGMRCWCCDREIRLARKVKLRPWRQFVPQGEMQADDPAYAFYEKEMTYRWAVICQGCYGQLDNAVGV